MNLYFLLIAILQLFPEIAPVHPATVWFPIFIIFTVRYAHFLKLLNLYDLLLL